ncbi:MAG: GxxExxY protein [Candidatus Aureabacteria bacterium]|nr:GxxExxY protein [Candidatus Auribacterota bacterium]
MDANQKEVKDVDFLYKDLSYRLVGCFYEVYNELGPAHKEQIYHKALKLSFDSIGIDYQSKKRLDIYFRDQAVGIYEPDFIIEDRIIVELKSVLIMPSVFEQQLFYYLKGTDYKVGYLVNFGSEKIDIRRRVYETARKQKSA